MSSVKSRTVFWNETVKLHVDSITQRTVPAVMNTQHSAHWSLVLSCMSCCWMTDCWSTSSAQSWKLHHRTVLLCVLHVYHYETPVSFFVLPYQPIQSLSTAAADSKCCSSLCSTSAVQMQDKMHWGKLLLQLWLEGVNEQDQINIIYIGQWYFICASGESVWYEKERALKVMLSCRWKWQQGDGTCCVLVCWWVLVLL